MEAMEDPPSFNHQNEQQQTVPNQNQNLNLKKIGNTLLTIAKQLYRIEGEELSMKEED